MARSLILTGLPIMLLAGCGGGSNPGTTNGSPGPVATATPTPAPTPTPSPSPSPTTAGLFVNPASDPANAGRAMVYVGWSATAGASGYVVSYSIDGGAATALAPGNVTGVAIGNLPPGSAISVTLAAVVGGAASGASAAVAATLPRAPTAAEMAAYNSAAAFSDANSGEAVVIQRYGATVFSRYSNGYTGGQHSLASGTKSFSCAFAGFAEQDGALKLTDKASSVITEWQGDAAMKGKVTLLDLLSLQSGLTGNPGYSALTAPTLDTYQLSVTDTATYAPGQAFVYDPLSFQAFALYFQAKTGGTYAGNGQITGGTDPVSYLQDRLFTPLGIASSAYSWQRDAKNRPQMAGGASLSANDWLKYGQFALQRGTWQSVRLLPAATIDYCTGGYKNPAYLGYGIGWWLNAHNAGTFDALDRVPADGAPQDGSDQFAPHAPADTFMAAGTGKERLYVIPSLGLVIVRLAPLNSGGAGSAWSDDTFLGKVVGVLP